VFLVDGGVMPPSVTVDIRAVTFNNSYTETWIPAKSTQE
jgi:hypothetical protein